MKVAIYARESSDDLNKAPPIQLQIDRGYVWAKENNHEVVMVFSDNGISGGDWKRPAWNKSVNDAKRHAYQILWVWNQDRLARDTEQFLWYYRQLDEAKVKIYEDTSKEFIDMSTLGGRVKHQSLAQAAEIFRLVTRDKVKAAYKKKLNPDGTYKTGEHWGRDPVPEEIRVKARELHASGMSYRKVAEALPSYKTKSGKERRVSYVWVKQLIKPTVKKSP